MSCDNCVIRAEAQGRQVIAEVRLDRMEKVAASVERGCILYRCSQCETFWESCAYEPWPREVDAQFALLHYPTANS